MPSILSDNDKQTVRRTVPKPSNKIHAVAVAKLYIAYPDRSRWTYTGLQGAAVFAYDTVGNTFWLKLVDVSPSNRGVIWDQEIYDTFMYNQDRTFFHTFELEDCLAGLSFADEKEARKFRQKLEEQTAKVAPITQADDGGGHHHRFGISRLFGRDKHSHAPPAQSLPIPHRTEAPSVVSPRGNSASQIDMSDPAVQSVVGDLLKMGISEDQIDEHADFIRSYIEKNKATNGAHSAFAGSAQASAPSSGRAPPPPPPGAPPGGISPQHTGSTTASRRGPPPAPPPARRTKVEPYRSSSPEPARQPSPPSGPRFRAPPPLADAGKFAGGNAPAPPSRARATSAATPTPGPPPPPRPPKTPLEDEVPSSRHAVPPPFAAQRSPVPPPTPNRGPVPPPPPARDTADHTSHAVHAVPPPPPLPPKSPPDHGVGSPAPPPPPLPPPNSRAPPLPPTSSGPPAPPPPPPLPSSSGPPAPPPPPPLPSSSAPPPPPLPPGRDNAPAAPPLPKPSAGGDGRSNLLADIRGGARLKKVSDSEKRDRSAAMVPGAEPSGGAGPTAPSSGGGADGGLAGALASALAARKAKVSHSDDEDDGDEW